jgi:hypothetical protein
LFYQPRHQSGEILYALQLIMLVEKVCEALMPLSSRGTTGCSYFCFVLHNCHSLGEHVSHQHQRNDETYWSQHYYCTFYHELYLLQLKVYLSWKAFSINAKQTTFPCTLKYIGPGWNGLDEYGLVEQSQSLIILHISVIGVILPKPYYDVLDSVCFGPLTVITVSHHCIQSILLSLTVLLFVLSSGVYMCLKIKLLLFSHSLQTSATIWGSMKITNFTCPDAVLVCGFNK